MPSQLSHQFSALEPFLEPFRMQESPENMGRLILRRASAPPITYSASCRIALESFALPLHSPHKGMETTLHVTCQRCHHWHNRITQQLYRGHTDVRCRNCAHKMFGLGGNSTHSSLISQETLEPPSSDNPCPISPRFCSNDRPDIPDIVANQFTAAAQSLRELSIVEKDQSRKTLAAISGSTVMSTTPSPTEQRNTAQPPVPIRMVTELATTTGGRGHSSVAALPGTNNASNNDDRSGRRRLKLLRGGVRRIERLLRLFGYDIDLRINSRRSAHVPDLTVPVPNRTEVTQHSHNSTKSTITSSLASPTLQHEQLQQTTAIQNVTHANQPLHASDGVEHSSDVVEEDRRRDPNSSGPLSRHRRRWELRHQKTEDAHKFICLCTASCRCVRHYHVDLTHASTERALGSNDQQDWDSQDGRSNATSAPSPKTLDFQDIGAAFDARRSLHDSLVSSGTGRTELPSRRSTASTGRTEPEASGSLDRNHGLNRPPHSIRSPLREPHERRPSDPASSSPDEHNNPADSRSTRVQGSSRSGLSLPPLNISDGDITGNPAV